MTNYDYKYLAQRRDWSIEWLCTRGKESVILKVEYETIVSDDLVAAAFFHKPWHLYCSGVWENASLERFAPLAPVIRKVGIGGEKHSVVRGLNNFTQLEEASLRGDLSEIDFAAFGKLRTLMVNPGSKKGNWHECVTLEHLQIYVPTPNLKKLTALKNLQTLSVGPGLKSLEGVEDLPALRELRIGGCHLASLESLGQLPNLRLLLLNLMPKLKSLAGVEGASNLEGLDVSQCGGLADVGAISQLSQLKMLYLHFCPHIRSLDGIRIPQTCKVSFTPGGKIRDGF